VHVTRERRNLTRILDFCHGRSLAVPAAVAALALAAEFGGEALRLELRYERAAIAGGDLWRLVSGHLVHLGPSHMLMNVAALAVMALIFGRVLRSRDWIAVALGAALAIDAGLFWVSTGVGWYVGLSGVLHGFWAAASLRLLIARSGEGALFGALLIAKLLYEPLLGPVPLTAAVAAGPVVTSAHTYGAIGGVLGALGVVAVERLNRRL